MATGGENADAAVAAEMVAEEAGRPATWYGDSAYGPGELRAAIADAGHRAVVKPGPLRPSVPGGLTVDGFTAGHAAGTVTCPAGVTRRIPPSRTVTFGAVCRGCPLRERCTTRKDGRTLNVHKHDDLLRAARAAWPAARTSSGPSPRSPPAAASG